jgi:hypothetical protein
VSKQSSLWTHGEQTAQLAKEGTWAQVFVFPLDLLRFTPRLCSDGEESRGHGRFLRDFSCLARSLNLCSKDLSNSNHEKVQQNLEKARRAKSI